MTSEFVTSNRCHDVSLNNPPPSTLSRAVCFTRLAARWRMGIVLWVRDKRQSQPARKKLYVNQFAVTTPYYTLLYLTLLLFVACNCNLADNFIDSLTFRLIAVGKRVLHFATLPPMSLRISSITMRPLFLVFFFLISSIFFLFCTFA